MNKNVVITGIIVLIVIAIAAYFFLPRFFMSNQEAASLSSVSDQQESMSDTTVPTGNLLIQDGTIGTGAEATTGKTVTVNYVGRLQDGTVFDASEAHGQPFSFTLGAGSVIKGWDQGIVGMKVGGKRLLSIPPALAYGSRAIQGRTPEGQVVDVIPANSTLIFEVELLKVE